MQNMRLLQRVGWVVLGFVFALAAGCGEDEPPVSKETKLEQDRLSEIRQRTGYDYSKATEEDKKFLLDTCRGDQNCAQMLLYKPKPGGPAGRSGPPGGGPPRSVGG